MKTTLTQLFSRPFHVFAKGQMIIVTRPQDVRKEDVLNAIYRLPKADAFQPAEPNAQPYGETFVPQVKRQLLVAILPDNRIEVIPLAVTPLDTHGLRQQQWLQQLLPANYQFTVLEGGVAVSDEAIQGEQLLDLVDAFEIQLDAFQSMPFANVIEQLAGDRPVSKMIPAPTAKVRKPSDTRETATA